MLEQELKNIWRNSSRAEKIKFDLSRLLIDLKGKMNRIEKSIRRRDKVEITVAILMIPIFGYFVYEIPFPLTKIGSILTIIWFVYLIFKLRDVKKHKPPVDLTLSFRKQLENQKAYMLQQARLLDTVLYWYLLPPLVANAILVLGLGDPAEYAWTNSLANKILPIPLMSKIVYLVFVAVLYAGILWINKRTVNKTFKPVIKEIERVQHQLESEQ